MSRLVSAALLLAAAARCLAADAPALAAVAIADTSTDADQGPGPGQLETVVVQATRPGGPEVSPSGANAYTATAQDIEELPAGRAATLSDVLAQMPGVAIDQNQQIHIRNTEGPQFQYQINGLLVPLDINTNPPFLSMLNPLFIQQLDLLDGVLPARYSYATGGVVDIRTKDGCQQSGGELSLLAGQRDTLQPSLQYAGCSGQLSSYVSALYDQSNMAFSSATPGPNPIHDHTSQGQAFGFFSYPVTAGTRLSLMLSAAASTNQLPNVPGLPPQYTLAGIQSPPPSAAINSDLDFNDYLAVLAIDDSPLPHLSYQLAYTEHAISQRFVPDPVGELVYQGVASTASHVDHDHTLEGDLTYAVGSHTLGTGFYAGEYRVSVTDSSLVFPVDAGGAQSSSVPLRIIDDSRADNILLGVYVNDLWQLTPRLRVNAGLRWDGLTGFARGQQLDPTLNLAYAPSAATTFHAGVARYFQIPSLLGISPTAQAAFAGTTAAGPPGVPTPTTEDDLEWDAGVVHRLTAALSVSADAYYERTRNYLDTGQFGVVPIFAPFNYGRGHIWGTEIAARYDAGGLGAYANLTAGMNWQRGVVTGQLNFPADELAYIDSHDIVLDHQPLYGASAGASYRWHDCAIGIDGIYSSGLRAGFADLQTLPQVVQVNLSLQRDFRILGLGVLSNRISALNILDRTNLIRPADGIGIFQSAYGPRLTIFDSVTLRF